MMHAMKKSLEAEKNTPKAKDKVPKAKRGGGKIGQAPALPVHLWQELTLWFVDVVFGALNSLSGDGAGLRVPYIIKVLSFHSNSM